VRPCKLQSKKQYFLDRPSVGPDTVVEGLLRLEQRNLRGGKEIMEYLDIYRSARDWEMSPPKRNPDDKGLDDLEDDVEDADEEEDDEDDADADEDEDEDDDLDDDDDLDEEEDAEDDEDVDEDDLEDEYDEEDEEAVDDEEE